jgi:tryptophan-rich sensory protein
MDIKKLLLCVLLCLGAGGAGSFFTTPSIGTWYALLQKPEFTPPNWLFGPVWTVLYIMMGIALYIVWQKRSRWHRGKVAAYRWFGVQLGLNVMWSVVFFGLHSLSGGLVVIVCLWLAIAATIREFGKKAPMAAWLLVPYLIWVSYASFLNFSFWRLNS